MCGWAGPIHLVALDSLRIPAHGLAPNEGGVVTDHFAAFGAGFFLWIGSFVIGVVGGAAVTVIAALEKQRPSERAT